MPLKTIFIYWPLLAIVIVTVLCRLIHNAKIAERMLEKKPDQRRPAASLAYLHDTTAIKYTRAIPLNDKSRITFWVRTGTSDKRTIND